MALRPEFGASAGQKYPVLRSIQIFLGQMAEGGARAASAVIKELLQNADDAGATDVAVVLDERTPPPGILLQQAQGIAKVLYTPSEKPAAAAPGGATPQVVQPAKPQVPLSSSTE